MADLLFYSFAFVLLMAAIMVISAKNPVRSVLFLILAFLNAAILLLMLGAEFISMSIIIVYVGAVAVLFLFVVMMLDVDFAQTKQGFLQHFPLGIGIGVLILLEIGFAVYESSEMLPAAGVNLVSQTTNTQALGLILYTDYILPFQLTGFLLLAAMIGAIVITFRLPRNVRKQSIRQQIARTREESMKLMQPKLFQGVSTDE